jgi:hypothetical protein
MSGGSDRSGRTAPAKTGERTSTSEEVPRGGGRGVRSDLDGQARDLRPAGFACAHRGLRALVRTELQRSVRLRLDGWAPQASRLCLCAPRSWRVSCNILTDLSTSNPGGPSCGHRASAAAPVHRRDRTPEKVRLAEEMAKIVLRGPILAIRVGEVRMRHAIFATALLLATACYRDTRSEQDSRPYGRQAQTFDAQTTEGDYVTVEKDSRTGTMVIVQPPQWRGQQVAVVSNDGRGQVIVTRDVGSRPGYNENGNWSNDPVNPRGDDQRGQGDDQRGQGGDQRGQGGDQRGDDGRR